MLSKNKIKLVKSLEHKKFRDENGLFVAEGEKLVGEILMSDFEVDSLYILPEAKLPQTNIKAEIISEDEMKHLSFLKTPPKAFVVAKIPTHKINVEQISNSLTLALCDVQDPGNLGTIARIANWFGIHTIICSACTADIYAPKAVQATMGAITRVKFFYVNLSETLAQIGKKTNIYGTFIAGENIYNAKLQPTGVIVMGNEGNGISAEIEKIVTKKLNIPCFANGKIKPESLNVAVATAIVCSEFKRRM